MMLTSLPRHRDSIVIFAQQKSALFAYDLIFDQINTLFCQANEIGGQKLCKLIRRHKKGRYTSVIIWTFVNPKQLMPVGSRTIVITILWLDYGERLIFICPRTFSSGRSALYYVLNWLLLKSPKVRKTFQIYAALAGWEFFPNNDDFVDDLFCFELGSKIKPKTVTKAPWERDWSVAWRFLLSYVLKSFYRSNLF